MADLTLPTPNKTPGDGAPADDTNLIIEAVNTLNSAVENISAGPQGPQGEPGTPGAAGANASVTVGSTNTGAAGSDASVTNSGTAQDAVFNFTIPRGETGATGATGATGSQGPTGNAGSDAVVSVGTVSTGAPGSVVSITNSGSPSSAVFNFSIPRGDVGATGATGAKGDTGDAATIAVGTVTTGDPGTSAVITNAGSSGAAVFDFTIPRGDVGPTGPPANLSSSTPQNLGTAAVGVATDAARGDHVHNMPSASDVGADPAGSASSAQTAAQSYADGLASNYDAAGSASAAQTAAESYADGLASNYDSAGSAAAAQTAAEGYADGLASNYDPAGSASAAQSAAQSYADGLAANYDPAGSASAVAGDLTTHEGLTTSVHGISDTANLVYTGDSRLSDARTPTAHATSHESGGTDELELAPSQVTGTAVVDSDSRLTDARTPTDGSVTTAKIVDANVTNAKLENDSITINGSAVALGGSVSISGLPTQSGNAGKYLTTDGSDASWASITTDPTPTVFFLGGM